MNIICESTGYWKAFDDCCKSNIGMENYQKNNAGKQSQNDGITKYGYQPSGESTFRKGYQPNGSNQPINNTTPPKGGSAQQDK